MKFHCCRYGQLYCSNVERPFDFVTSVYRAKATRSTFNKVDRVEFNFVASVYRALELRARNDDDDDSYTNKQVYGWPHGIGIVEFNVPLDTL